MRSGNAASRERPYDASYPDGFDPSACARLDIDGTGIDAWSPAMPASAGTRRGHAPGTPRRAGDTETNCRDARGRQEAQTRAIPASARETIGSGTTSCL
jgi:hypothetical protein